MNKFFSLFIHEIKNRTLIELNIFLFSFCKFLSWLIFLSNGVANNWFYLNETNELKKEDWIFVLVGNKTDLEENRIVQIKVAEDFLTEKGFLISNNIS